MRYFVLQLFLVLSLFLPLNAPSVPAAEKSARAEPLPDLVLEVPENPRHKEYLGLTGKNGTDFSIRDIDADILLIELFSMYCPYCQKEAPAVNELYAKTREISKNGPVVKIIGLGVANSQFEVDHFRDTYKIAFPLFADEDKTMFRALAGEGTPTFIGCRLKDGERPVIVLRQNGGFTSSARFLQELIDKGGPHQ